MAEFMSGLCGDWRHWVRGQGSRVRGPARARARHLNTAAFRYGNIIYVHGILLANLCSLCVERSFLLLLLFIIKVYIPTYNLFALVPADFLSLKLVVGITVDARHSELPEIGIVNLSELKRFLRMLPS